MSGGSFNYLYGQKDARGYFDPDDIKAMADDLRRRGMDAAAEETMKWSQTPEPDQELLSLWRAVEWHRSNDWSEAQVARAFAVWEASNTGTRSDEV